MRERVRMIMGEVFGVELAELGDEVTSSGLPAWDSLAHLELMLELELEFGVEILSEEMPKLLSLDAIERYLQRELQTT